VPLQLFLDDGYAAGSHRKIPAPATNARDNHFLDRVEFSPKTYGKRMRGQTGNGLCVLREKKDEPTRILCQPGFNDVHRLEQRKAVGKRRTLEEKRFIAFESLRTDDDVIEDVIRMPGHAFLPDNRAEPGRLAGVGIRSVCPARLARWFATH
jgi:hypothetical protein